jgi:hypothetical protein
VLEYSSHIQRPPLSALWHDFLLLRPFFVWHSIQIFTPTDPKNGRTPATPHPSSPADGIGERRVLRTWSKSLASTHKVWVVRATFEYMQMRRHSSDRSNYHNHPSGHTFQFFRVNFNRFACTCSICAAGEIGELSEAAKNKMLIYANALWWWTMIIAILVPPPHADSRRLRH